MEALPLTELLTNPCTYKRPPQSRRFSLVLNAVAALCLGGILFGVALVSLPTVPRWLLLLPTLGIALISLLRGIQGYRASGHTFIVLSPEGLIYGEKTWYIYTPWTNVKKHQTFLELKRQALAGLSLAEGIRSRRPVRPLAPPQTYPQAEADEASRGSEAVEAIGTVLNAAGEVIIAVADPDSLAKYQQLSFSRRSGFSKQIPIGDFGALWSDGGELRRKVEQYLSEAYPANLSV